LITVQMWRGANARRRVKRMRAIRTIMAAFSRYKLRAYMDRIRTAFK